MRTERLLLRPWQEEDREPFAAMNADPIVMEHFRSPLTRERSDALADHAQAHLAEHGWGLWAVDVVEPGPSGRTGFAGFTGLNPAPAALPCAPAVEVGWRLARWAWGSGYATEAARAALAVAFDDLGLEQVVSFTAVANTRSQAVMARLGMRCDRAEDFDHPHVPVGSPVRRCVLHRITAEERATRRVPQR